MLPLITKVIENPPWDGRKREHNGIMRKAHDVQGRHWADEFLPRHFTPQARGLYGYQPRKRSTVFRKLRAAKHGRALLGGRVDLVWSGFLMRSVLGHQAIRSTPTAVTVRMFGPRYLYKYDKRKGQPNKADELRAVSPDEVTALEQLLQGEYERGAREHRETKTTVAAG